MGEGYYERATQQNAGSMRPRTDIAGYEHFLSYGQYPLRFLPHQFAPRNTRDSPCEPDLHGLRCSPKQAVRGSCPIVVGPGSKGTIKDTRQPFDKLARPAPIWSSCGFATAALVPFHNKTELD